MQAVLLLALLLIAGAPVPCRGCDAVEGETTKRACASTFTTEMPRMFAPLAEEQKVLFCCHAEKLRLCVQRGYVRAGCESERAAFPSQLRAVVRRVAGVDCDAHVGRCDAPRDASSTAAPLDIQTAAPLDIQTAAPLDIQTAAPLDIQTAAPLDVTSAVPSDATAADPLDPSAADPSDASGDAPFETSPSGDRVPEGAPARWASGRGCAAPGGGGWSVLVSLILLPLL